MKSSLLQLAKSCVPVRNKVWISAAQIGALPSGGGSTAAVLEVLDWSGGRCAKASARFENQAQGMKLSDSAMDSHSIERGRAIGGGPCAMNSLPEVSCCGCGRYPAFLWP